MIELFKYDRTGKPYISNLGVENAVNSLLAKLGAISEELGSINRHLQDIAESQRHHDKYRFPNEHLV